ETLLAIRPMYFMRIAGGTLYLAGFVLMAWNLAATIHAGRPVNTTITMVEPEPEAESSIVPWQRLVLSLLYFAVAQPEVAVLVAVALLVLAIGGWLMFALRSGGGLHRLLEGRALLFTGLALFAVLVGGIAELVPTLIVDRAVPKTGPIAQPYRPLELHGRDIYVREGCYVCHSQMIRPL